MEIKNKLLFQSILKFLFGVGFFPDAFDALRRPNYTEQSNISIFIVLGGVEMGIVGRPAPSDCLLGINVSADGGGWWMG